MLARIAPLTLLLLTLAVAAAGCGKSQSAEEKWANEVCGHVTTWKDSVTTSVNDIENQVKSPSSASIDSIKSSVSSISDATSKLASDLKSTGAPNTPAGTQAKQQLDTFANQLQSSVESAKKTTSSIPANAGITETLTTLASLAPTLQSLGTTAQTTLKSIQPSASSLKDGFQKANSCKPYR
jgi:tetrahydromethanopterin S-methyltransferase subunit B